jgi:hypothetical protein
MRLYMKLFKPTLCVLENTVLPYEQCLKCTKMPPSPKHASSIQNLKSVADKISWKVQYQDRVVEGRFQVRVVLTPPRADTVELAWCEGGGRKEARHGAAEAGLVFFDGQPLTLVLGSKYERNDSQMRE